MSNDTKVKVYKNPGRNAHEAHKPYVPQYQLLGVEPTEYKSPLSPGYPVPMTKTPLDTNNTRASRPALRQPYAEAVTSPVGIGRGPLPNVGNNIEQTWSGVDGEVIDDISLDPQHPMVDNNEFVSNEALGLPESAPLEGPKKDGFFTENQLKDALSQEYLHSVINQLDEGDFLLLVNGETICSGPESYIQEQTTALVFGEHELYHGNPVSVDDIVVLRKVPIKVGVFLK